MIERWEELWRRHGTPLGDYLGGRLPASFAGLPAEYEAARAAAVVFSVTYRTLLLATGSDRATFLQGMLTNDVRALTAGQGCRAALLNQTGKIVADLRVYAETDRILLDVFTTRAAPVCEALNRYIVADDVEVHPADTAPLIGLAGPTAPAVLARLGAAPASPPDVLQHWTATVGGRPVRVVAVSEVEGEGFVICGTLADGLDLFEAASAAGAIPIGMEAINVLRVAAGVPWYGIDMDETHLVMEVGLDRAISFTKGCYLGQEYVERVAARGHVNRRLSALCFTPDVPASGAKLTRSGHEVGWVTSAVRSPDLGPIGLGYVHRECWDPGTTLDAATPGGSLTATVTTLPFPAK
jgi:folate-binding protein YgfZ